MLTDGGGGGTSFEEDLDSVAPRSAPAGASEPPPPGGVGLGIRTVRLFGEAGPAPGVGGGGTGAGGGDAALDYKLAAAVLRTGGGGGTSGSDEDEVSEVRLRDPRLPHKREAWTLFGVAQGWGQPRASRAQWFSDSTGLHGGAGCGAGLVSPGLTPQLERDGFPSPSVDPQWGALRAVSFAREQGLLKLPPARRAVELGAGGGVLPESLPLVLRETETERH